MTGNAASCVARNLRFALACSAARETTAVAALSTQTQFQPLMCRTTQSQARNGAAVPAAGFPIAEAISEILPETFPEHAIDLVKENP
ncbi:MAG: hypothetical protein ABI767_00960 [Rhodanobacter sp.]